MDQIEQAIQRQEPDRVRLASHRLKGMLARYAYHEAADVVRELERMGEAGTLDAARPLHGRLARMVHRLGGAIATDLRHHAESHGGAR